MPISSAIGPSIMQGWQCTRITTQNIEAVKNTMRQRMMNNYVDEEFPHNVVSLGQNIQV